MGRKQTSEFSSTFGNSYMCKMLAGLLLVYSFINISYAESDNYTKGIIQSDSTFKCESIAILDQGMAMDRPAEFYDMPTQEYLCTYGMAGNKCAFTGVGQTCTCPPDKWAKNGCWEKYSVFRKLEEAKYQKNKK